MTRDATENDRNVSSKTVAATFENYFGSAEVSSEKVWEKVGFFDARKSENSLEKVNFPKNTLIYLNQSYLTVKENKKIFYRNYFITGQISESSNPPEDVSSHTLKENEVEMVTSRYDLDMSEFKGLYETIGYLVDSILYVIQVSLRRCFSIMDLTVKNQNFIFT